MHDSRGIEIVNFTISLALSAGTLMASVGTPYRLVPAHFYPSSAAKVTCIKCFPDSCIQVSVEITRDHKMQGNKLTNKNAKHNYKTRLNTTIKSTTNNTNHVCKKSWYVIKVLTLTVDVSKSISQCKAHYRHCSNDTEITSTMKNNCGYRATIWI